MYLAHANSNMKYTFYFLLEKIILFLVCPTLAYNSAKHYSVIYLFMLEYLGYFSNKYLHSRINIFRIWVSRYNLLVSSCYNLIQVLSVNILDPLSFLIPTIP